LGCGFQVWISPLQLTLHWSAASVVFKLALQGLLFPQNLFLLAVVIMGYCKASAHTLAKAVKQSLALTYPSAILIQPKHVVYAGRPPYGSPRISALFSFIAIFCSFAAIMEIVFRSPAQPDRFLHDALANNRWETLSALLSAICDMVFTTSLLGSNLLRTSLTALEIQESLFREALTSIDFIWYFTLKEQYVI
jgi:hypothetical protein